MLQKIEWFRGICRQEKCAYSKEASRANQVANITRRKALMLLFAAGCVGVGSAVTASGKGQEGVSLKIDTPIDGGVKILSVPNEYDRERLVDLLASQIHQGKAVILDSSNNKNAHKIFELVYAKLKSISRDDKDVFPIAYLPLTQSQITISALKKQLNQERESSKKRFYNLIKIFAVFSFGGLALSTVGLVKSRKTAFDMEGKLIVEYENLALERISTLLYLVSPGSMILGHYLVSSEARFLHSLGEVLRSRDFLIVTFE